MLILLLHLFFMCPHLSKVEQTYLPVYSDTSLCINKIFTDADELQDIKTLKEKAKISRVYTHTHARTHTQTYTPLTIYPLFTKW